MHCEKHAAEFAHVRQENKWMRLASGPSTANNLACCGQLGRGTAIVLFKTVSAIVWRMDVSEGVLVVYTTQQ